MMEVFRSDFRHSRKTRKFCISAPGGHNFDPSEKNDRNNFDRVFDDLSNAACRMSLRRSVAELDGGG